MSDEVFLFLPPAAAGNYREAYPYGPDGGGFHTDLGIEIAPAGRANSPALAVINGMFRWVADPDPATTGTLVLVPTPSLMQSLGAVFDSTVVFVYRNIERSSMLPFFQPRVNAVVGDVFKQDAGLAEFCAGKYPVWVDAGDKLGAPADGAGGWGRLGFEIVYVPPLARGTQGLARLLQLIDPQAMTRRLDPMSFYARVATSTQYLTLAQAHAAHPLLTIPTRRVLLELRDEYDAPSTLTVDLTNSTAGVTSPQGFDVIRRGTVVLDTAPANGAAAAASYSVAKTDYVFSILPSGLGAQFTAASLTAPAHWALQSLYLPPGNSVAEEPECWFVPNTVVTTTPPLMRYTSGNRITALRDGRDVFAACAEAIRTAENPDHFILMANWWFDDSFRLVLGDGLSTLESLYTWAASKGVLVRALLFAQPRDPQNMMKIQNSAEVDRINALNVSHARAILDDETLFLGSHHQKFMVVKGVDESGLQRVVGFCGGVDFNANRRDSHAHMACGGYHDVHAKVEGPAVFDLFQSFKDRWDIHPVLSFSVNLDASMAPPVGTVFTQVARTYPKSKGYAFAPQGSYTPLKALLRAIEKAKKFIYIEDQYLTPYPGLDPETAAGDTLHVLEALRDALTRIDYLLIVIPNHTEMAWFKKLIAYLDFFNLLPNGSLFGWAAAQLPGQARFRRKMFIQGLKSNEATRPKVHVYYLGRTRKHSEALSVGLDEATEGDGDLSSGGQSFRSEIYCHSKVWIVDDVVAKIGSANCNRRSYTHDSEMDLVMVDGSLSKGARAFARNFRMELWAEHLGLGKAKMGMLEDHMHALDYWRGPRLPGSHVYAYDETADAPENSLMHQGWDLIIDPQA